MKRGLPITMAKDPSQIRSGVSLISHVGDTQVLEKRRYVDRELGGRERGREGEREGARLRRRWRRRAWHYLPAVQAAVGREAGRCMLCSVPQVVTHSVPKRCSPTIPIQSYRVGRTRDRSELSTISSLFDASDA